MNAIPSLDGLEHALARPGADEPAVLARLEAELGERAARTGLLDVAYRVVASPVGPLLLAATPAGLVRVAYAAGLEDAVLQELADRVSARVVHAPARLDGVAAQLDEYFAGRRTRFELDLDWQLARGFRATVLHHLDRELGYGRTASYGAVAASVGRPRAVRAVGTACATNPLPVVVPCHRVVRGDGTPGGYVGGLAAKQTLLRLENAA